MTITHNIEWAIERGEEDAFDICIDYEMSPIIPARLYGPPEDCYPAEGGEIEIISVWRKADENDPNAPEFELTDDEREKIELWLLENPPEPDYGEDW